MLQEFEKIIDIESTMSFIGTRFEGKTDIEDIIAIVGEIKIFDFFASAFRPEFNLQGTWHEQELSQIKRRLERCVTIDQKKSYIEGQLSEQEILFKEHEYFEVIEELKDTTLKELFGKINRMKQGFTKTSRWLESSEDDRTILSIVEEIPNSLPTTEELNNLSMQKIRSHILSRPSLYFMFQKLMGLKRGKIPPSKLIMDIVSDIFSMFYASKVNVYLREEYQKLIPKSDYQLAEVISNEDITLPQIEWQGTQKELAELFLELNRKGFINDIPTKLIKQYFTNSNSIEQVLKPTHDARTKVKTYEGIYTPAYRPRFDSIRQKP
jgi:hypothetical protein